MATPGRPPMDDAVIWHPVHLERVEALKARYVRQQFVPHRHDGFLLGIIEQGTHAVWCRGIRTLAGPGCVATMDPEEVHHGGAGEPSGWRQRMLYVPEPLVAELLEDAWDRRPPPAALHFRECFRRDEAVARDFLALHRALEGRAEPLDLECRFERMVGDLFSRFAAAPGPEPRPTAGPRLERARDFLHDHLREPCRLGDLARVAGLRRRHLAEAFRIRFGLPPHRYLTQLRIDAARRLRASGAPASEVAAEVGFADQSHLVRRFKAAMGVTPGRYRAACRS